MTISAVSCNKLGRKCIWSLCERQPWNTRRRYRISAASSSFSCASLGSLALQAQLPHSESETQPGQKVRDGSQSIRSVSDVQRARALFWNTPSDLWHIGVDTSRLFNEALLVERFEPSVWVFIPSKSFLNEMKLNIFYRIIFLMLAVLYYLCSMTYISCCKRATASLPESKQRFSCPLWPEGPSLLASQLLRYRSSAFIDRPTRFWLVKVWPALATPWIWTQVTRVNDQRWCDT